MENYESAIRLMNQYPTMQHFVGARSESLIQFAERLLGLTFPPTYSQFLSEYGAGSFGAFEVYGLISEDPGNNTVPDGVWYSLKLHKEGLLARELLMVGSDGMGGAYCIDCSNRIAGGECAVVLVEPGNEHSMQFPKMVALDFGEYFLRAIEQEVLHF